MSDPNLNDAVEPTAGAFESAEDELDIVEAADAEEPDQAEAADAAAGDPAELAALHVESADEAEEVESGDDEDEDEASDEDADEATDEADEATDEADEEEAELAEPVDAVTALREELRTLPGEWYVIHTYAGYEKRVKANLEQRAVSLNVEEFVYQAEVPEEEIVQIKNGERKNVRQNKLPGYVLVRMDLTNESWGVVRNTPGVTGFVGNAYDPYPLTLDEIVKMLAPEAEEKAAREAAEAEGKPACPARSRSRCWTSRSATRSPSPTAPSRRCRRRSTRSTPTRRRSRVSSRSSAARRRSSSASTRSRRTSGYSPASGHMPTEQVRPAVTAGLTCSVFGRAAIPVIVVRYACIRMTG